MVKPDLQSDIDTHVFMDHSVEVIYTTNQLERHWLELSSTEHIISTLFRLKGSQKYYVYKIQFMAVAVNEEQL